MSCLIKRLMMVSKETPNKILLETENKQYSYADFFRYCNKICKTLVDHGFQRGDIVATVLERYDEFYASVLAIWEMGGVAVPLNVMLSDDQLQTLISTSGSNFLIMDSSQGKDLVCSQVIDIHDAQNVPELYATHDGLTDDELAVIMFTSGTTGVPKGVCQTYFSQHENVRLTAKALGLSSKDRIFINTPPYFTSGLSHFLTILEVGGSLVGIRKFYFGSDLIQALIQYKCTGFGGAPAHLIRVVETLTEPCKNNQIRFWMSSGDHLPKHIIQKMTDILPNVQLYNAFGLTECSGRLCILPPSFNKNKCGSVGKPIGQMTVTIRDENFNEMKPCEMGEIYVTGPLLMRGYLNSPELTERVLTPFGFCTGDFGYKDEDGFVWLEGRKDDVFKVGGEKVSANQVKQALFDLGLFEDAVVIAADDRLLGKVPVAFVVMKKNDGECSSSLIRKKLKKLLPLSHIPMQFIKVDMIPRTGSGKAVRSELKRLLENN